MDIEIFLEGLEKHGLENDSLDIEKSKKYLNITKDTGQFLSFLVKSSNSKNILEIGTSNGYSTIWLAKAIPEDGLVTTIELNPQKIKEAESNFRSTGLSKRINQIHGNAETVLDELSGEFDLIFLDSERSIYFSIKERIVDLLKKGGIIVVDNAISHRKEVEDFIQYFESRSEYTCCLVPVGKGEFLVYK
jgi:predicted O-methyltransferase YrrM